MKIAIMQPYFFPYIGYWQLINTVDKFVVYDNIQFIKNSWIKRNRILLNGQDMLISLPIRKDSDYLDVRERFLAENFSKKRIRILNQIEIAYKKAPEFYNVMPIIKECIINKENNLFNYIFYSIIKTLHYLDIDTKIIISSNIDMDHSLKKQDRIFNICKVLGGTTYFNPIGGVDLYHKEEFLQEGIELKFIKTDSFNYDQFQFPFIPNLSIIDVMMFNSKDNLKKILGYYSII